MRIALVAYNAFFLIELIFLKKNTSNGLGMMRLTNRELKKIDIEWLTIWALNLIPKRRLEIFVREEPSESRRKAYPDK